MRDIDEVSVKVDEVVGAVEESWEEDTFPWTADFSTFSYQ